MPLFSRWDGELVRDESPLRGIVPYLMRRRNESVVYHEEIVDLTRALPWIERWNAAHPTQRITPFHLLLAGCSRVLWSRSGLNRFISGNRIWQRKGVQISFAAKKRFEDRSPIVTLKMEMPESEPFSELVARCHGGVKERRGDAQNTVDKELALAMALPGFVLSPAMGLLQWLDSVNLLPGAMARTDPLFASLFLANLGSLGIDRTWHHLYEWGTISLFGVLGQVRKHQFIAEDGTSSIRDAVSIRWSFDERIADGFYCASSLKLCNAVLEDPESVLGSPA